MISPKDLQITLDNEKINALIERLDTELTTLDSITQYITKSQVKITILYFDSLLLCKIVASKYVKAGWSEVRVIPNSKIPPEVTFIFTDNRGGKND